MWVHFLKDDRRRIRPKPSGIVTSVVDYRAGMVENVPKEYGLRLVDGGKAEATVSPAKKDTDHADKRPASADGPAKPTAG